MITLYEADRAFINKHDDKFDLVLEELPEEPLGLQIQLREVNEEQGFATVTALPIIYGEYFGFPMNNGWYPAFPINLQIDSALPQGESGSNSFLFEVEYQGGFDAVLDLAPGSPSNRSTTRWYPLDEYHFTFPVGGMYAFPCAEESENIECTSEIIAEYRKQDPTVDDAGWADLPIFIHPYLSSADTFVASMRPMAFSDEWDTAFSAEKIGEEAGNGFTSMGISVRRDATIKIAAVAVALLMLATVFSVVIMAVMVASRHRPPTIQALVWAAALTFALLQMRNLYPSNPPLGIWLDYVVYFPALIITMVCALWILLMWARRSDFEH